MTTETQIEVAFVNQPKGAAKSGTIKSKDGNTYGVWANDLKNYTPGATYAIEYVERQGTGDWAGRTFRDIKSAKLVPSENIKGANVAIPMNGASHNGGGGNQFRNPEQMFVEGLLTKAIENQTIHFTEESLTQSGLMLQTVWQRLWGGQ